MKKFIEFMIPKDLVFYLLYISSAFFAIFALISEWGMAQHTIRYYFIQLEFGIYIMLEIMYRNLKEKK